MFTLIFRLLVAALLFSSVSSFASLPMTPGGKVWTTAVQVANGVPLMDSAVFTGSNQSAESQAACNAMGKFSYPNGSQGTIYYSVPGGGCFVSGLGVLAVRTVSASCPSGSEQNSSGSCDCDSGYHESGNSCVADPPPNSCPSSGSAASFHVHDGWGIPSGKNDLSQTKGLSDSELWASVGSVCSEGCSYSYDINSPVNGGSQNDENEYWAAGSPLGKWVPLYGNYGYKSTGEKCENGNTPGTPSSSATKPADPVDGGDKAPENPAACAKAGGYWGEVNGTPACVQKSNTNGVGGAPVPTTGGQSGSSTDPGKTPAVTNKNGSSSTPGSGKGPGNGSGSGSGSGSGTGSGSGSGSNNGDKDKITCTDINTCDDSDSGGAIPGQPQLYQPKYQNGLSGVWSDKSSQLKQAPIFSVASSLLPSVDSGAAPSWVIDMSIPGLGDYGSYELSPDSSVWTILRAIVICSAVIFAFRLVFGGA